MNFPQDIFKSKRKKNFSQEESPVVSVVVKAHQDTKQKAFSLPISKQKQKKWRRIIKLRNT
jgi:hypothetical protein